MTDILDLARQAGMAVDEQVTDYTGDKYLYVSINELQAFAALIAQRERERCARVCEPQSNWDDPLTAYKICGVIRALGDEYES